MGTPFRIPKKKQQSDSSRIHMTSPLSRVQDGVTTKASWSGMFNGRRPQEKSCVPGKEEPRPGHTGAGRWRPKRASDTLCVREADDDIPAVKKQWGCGPVETRLSHSEDEEETQPASLSSEPRKPRAAVCLAGRSTMPTPSKTQAEESKKDIHKPRPSFEAPVRTSGAALVVPVRKVSSDRPYPTKKLHLQLSYKTYQRIKSRCMETIVLSSDDEDEREECGQHGGPGGGSKKSSQDSCAGPHGSSSTETTPVMELAFTTLHLGRTQTHANGPITITEECISIPLKGADGEGEVAVTMVPSELHSYGVWDGALARDGALLTDSTEPSPSFLFFSVSDAQASLLQKELSLIHTTHTLGKPCPFVLVLLANWLDDLRRATLASLLDLMSLRCGRASLATPLSWAEGLRKLRSHPSGTHLLTLLDHRGHAPSPAQHTEGNGDKEEGLCKTRKGRAGLEGGVSDVTSTRHASLRSHTRLQPLPRRLIQYPPPPSKGGITVTTEDLECLRDEEFLNDVIIDFYLKYLHLEWAERGVAERTHIFSSFFYKQLTRRSNSSEEEAGGTAQYRRHRRVRTWTRHVDIFTKDFLFIPVNQEAHWYLVVICFPGLLKPESVLTRCPALVEGSKATRKLQPHASAGPANHCRGRQLTGGNTYVSKGRLTPGALASSDPPDCTALTCQKEKVTRRPCILIMDSLKLSYHYGIYTLLREYLQVEWEVRRGTPRTFTDDVIKGSHCKVPLQDNSSDCGLYLLQYVESFLQNPVVHFELPLRLERWFPRQQVRRKREELRELVLRLYRRQGGAELSSS